MRMCVRACERVVLLKRGNNDVCVSVSIPASAPAPPTHVVRVLVSELDFKCLICQLEGSCRRVLVRERSG